MADTVRAEEWQPSNSSVTRLTEQRYWQKLEEKDGVADTLRADKKLLSASAMLITRKSANSRRPSSR